MFWVAAAAPRGRKQSPTDTVVLSGDSENYDDDEEKNKKRQVLSRVVADRRRRDHRFEITREIESALNHAREQGVSEVGQTRLVRGELEVREGVIEKSGKKAAFAKAVYFSPFREETSARGVFAEATDEDVQLYVKSMAERCKISKHMRGSLVAGLLNSSECGRRGKDRVSEMAKLPDGSETVETVDEGDREKVRGSCRCGGR